MIKALGSKPELKWIGIKDMYIDPAYQRKTTSDRSLKNLDYLREEFSWGHCGALIVCYIKATKKYAVLDGQHRMAAAVARGDIKELPCVIVPTELNIQNQAKSFVTINTKRVNIHTLAKFHAAITAEDPEALAVKKVMDKCDIKVPAIPVLKGKTLPRETQAISSVAGMVKKYAEEVVIWALTIIPEAYDDKHGMMRASLMKGLADFRRYNLDARREVMIRALKSTDPAELEASARAYMKIEGGTSIQATVSFLHRIYKKELRDGPTPPPAKKELPPVPRTMQEKRVAKAKEKAEAKSKKLSGRKKKILIPKGEKPSKEALAFAGKRFD